MTHIIGKVYPLTQVAFNKVLRELEALQDETKQLAQDRYKEQCRAEEAEQEVEELRCRISVLENELDGAYAEAAKGMDL